MNIKNLKKMIREGYITAREHDDLDLTIYDYTPKTQYEGNWNNETMMCRGLIMDGDYNIVARPFKKFFNIEELIGDLKPYNVFEKDFTVYEKYDGSLGILYWNKNKPCIATRGSFVSDPAIKGTEMIQKVDCSSLNKNYTYLFEIIYPENRIVVDYGNQEKLVLLAIINTETGEDMPLKSDIFETAKIYEGFDFALIKKIQNENKEDEGFVLLFEDGERVKIKNEEYKRLHRLVTQVTARSVWDLLRNNKPIDELLDRVPDEFYNWVKSIVGRLCREYKDIFVSANYAYREALKLDNRKDQAFCIMKKTIFTKAAFALLDNKPVEKIIWKLIYPKHETPFKQEL